ncbi:MAG: Trk system potassium transporter TrkA [Clostridiales bacterium]|jgi:trk system potassium uptake protein TrkA|nr:Trk system potassium transporter TrkA [Clostridiales bacterium]MDR2749294.1 Trk system potassium transporter TrkA [Clostridiales bacterium]
MEIIIIGDGKVGSSLAENLSRDNHEVTIIDKNADVLKKAVESLDVRCIVGNGVSSGVLIEAGVKEADLLIACTSSDEMNMVCCLTGKKLGVKHTIARIRDTQYADELSQLKEDLGLDMVINPERAVASEIARLLQFPPAVKVETFVRGRVEMIEIRIAPSMEIVNMTLINIARKFSQSILIGAILRGEDVIIPNGDVTLHVDDLVYIVGRPAQVHEFCRKIGIHMNKIKAAMIIGGGRVAYYLAKYLSEIQIAATIIERDRQRCVALQESLPNALIIHGDGTEDGLLKSENISQMQAFISVTGHDEDNLMSGLLAKQYGVGKVVAKISRMMYSGVVKNIGIDNIVNPKLITSNFITWFVRGMENAKGHKMDSLYKIVDGQAEAVEFTVHASHKRIVESQIKKIHLKPGIIIAAVTHKDETFIPHGNDRIHAGDSVVLFAKNTRITDLNDILEANGK